MPASLARPDYALADNLGADAGTVFLTGTQALIRLALMQRRARRRGRARVTRLHQRLPRLAARHGRPAGVEGGEAARRGRREVPARDQRGARRDGGARHAARRVRPRAHRRGRVRHVVRQGPGRRPRRRRAQARQRLRLVAARRRAGRRRRRPRLRLVVDAAPERPGDAVVAHAGAWRRPTSPSTSSSASTAGRCRASRATGSASRRSRRWSRAARRSTSTRRTRASPRGRARPTVAAATGFVAPADGLHYRWPDLPSLKIEQRLHAKLDAVRAFATVNAIDRDVVVAPQATVGIVTCGKAHFDLLEVLRRLDIPLDALAAAGVRIYKVGLTYPLEPTRMDAFAEGLDEILVIEEKARRRRAAAARPVLQPRRCGRRIVGKRDASGRPLVSELGELRPSRLIEIVAALAGGALPATLDRRAPGARLHAARAALERRRRGQAPALLLRRLPAQHLDQGARGLARAGRHRLPLHGHLDGPRHRGPDPDGRRRRRLGLARDVHQGAARVPEPRRRHLLPLGLPRDPPGDRGRRPTSPTRSSSTTPWR